MPDNEVKVAKFDKYRGDIVKFLLIGPADGPAKRDATPRKLKTLDIRNLPCRPQPDLTGHPSFSALLETLQTLVLKFDYNWVNDKPHGGSQRGEEPQEFFTNLPKTWLAPAATNLTSLTLGASQLWGYVLKIDFSDVHFPRLQSLVMEQFVFSHDWQPNWIVSHKFLQKLCLFQCRMLVSAIWTGGKDADGYPTTLLERDGDSLEHYHYSRSWNRYYDNFLKYLESLRWFSTEPDEWVATNSVGLYTTFDKYEWFAMKVGDDMRAKDEKSLEQLKAKTAQNMRDHLKATVKPLAG